VSETDSMKVMVFNNTSRYHNGCKKVMQYIHHDIRRFGHLLTESVYGYVSVREVKSQRQMQRMDVDADINIDLSYFVHVSPKKYKRNGTVIGRFFDKRELNSKQHVHVNIFKQDWDEIVNILRWSDCFITGRHHEMYAACKARCPFVVVEGNTWKNSGLMETAGVEIPVFTYEATNGQLMQGVDLMMEYADQFETLFNWMQKQNAPSFCNNITSI